MGLCFGNNKNVLFLNLNYKIIEQEMNKIAIHTHVIFRPPKNFMQQGVDH